MKLTHNLLKRIIKNEIKFLNETWETSHISTLVKVLEAFNALSKNIDDVDGLKTLKLTKSFLMVNGYIDQSDMELFDKFSEAKNEKSFNELKHTVAPKLQEALFNLQAE